MDTLEKPQGLPQLKGEGKTLVIIAEVLIFQEHFEPSKALKYHKIPWLDLNKMYKIEPLNLILSGAQLKYKGFKIPLNQRDFAVSSFSVQEIKE